MVLVTWSLKGESLQSQDECALSQVGAHSDMTLDIARI